MVTTHLRRRSQSFPPLPGCEIHDPCSLRFSLRPFSLFCLIVSSWHLIHTHEFNSLRAALIPYLYLQTKPLFWALDSISSCHGTSPLPQHPAVSRPSVSARVHAGLDSPSSLHTGRPPGRPISVNGATFSSLHKLASQGPPLYHPLSFSAHPVQHTKPSWSHLWDDFQIHLFNESLSLHHQGQPPSQVTSIFCLVYCIHPAAFQFLLQTPARGNLSKKKNWSYQALCLKSFNGFPLIKG